MDFYRMSVSKDNVACCSRIDGALSMDRFYSIIFSDYPGKLRTNLEEVIKYIPFWGPEIPCSTDGNCVQRS